MPYKDESLTFTINGRRKSQYKQIFNIQLKTKEQQNYHSSL